MLNQRSRTSLAIEIPAYKTPGECCVDPLRPPGLPEKWPQGQFPFLGDWMQPHGPAGRRVPMRRTRRKHPRLKTKLGLPDLEHAKTAVLISLRSPESQRSYQHSINEFVLWYCSEPRLSFNKTVVNRYRIHLEGRQLAPGTINVRLAAVRSLANEAADSRLLSPELAAGIRRVKVSKKLGIRLGNWLTVNEARTLWQLPDARTLKGKRA